MSPSNGDAHFLRGLYLATMDRTLALYPDAPFALHALGSANMGLGRLSNATEARQLLRALTGSPDDPLPDFAQALVHVGLGDCDRAFQCLERALAVRDSRIFWFSVVPGLDVLRADPRFPDLMRRVREACRS